jgi:hypothetical protein
MFIGWKHYKSTGTWWQHGEIRKGPQRRIEQGWLALFRRMATRTEAFNARRISGRTGMSASRNGSMGPVKRTHFSQMD